MLGDLCLRYNRAGSGEQQLPRSPESIGCKLPPVLLTCRCQEPESHPGLRCCAGVHVPAAFPPSHPHLMHPGSGAAALKGLCPLTSALSFLGRGPAEGVAGVISSLTPREALGTCGTCGSGQVHPVPFSPHHAFLPSCSWASASASSSASLCH